MKIELLSDEQIRRLHEASLRILATIGVARAARRNAGQAGRGGGRRVPADANRQAAGKTGPGKPAQRRQALRDLRPRSHQEGPVRFRPPQLQQHRRGSAVAGRPSRLPLRHAGRRPRRQPPGRCAAADHHRGRHVRPARVAASCRCVFVAAEQLEEHHQAHYVLVSRSRLRRDSSWSCSPSFPAARRRPSAIRSAIPSSNRSARSDFRKRGSTCCSRPAALICRCRSARWRRPAPRPPATLAGTMAQENAEILAGICLIQQIRPGTPVCYGGIPHVFDMRTTQWSLPARSRRCWPSA